MLLLLLLLMGSLSAAASTPNDQQQCDNPNTQLLRVFVLRHGETNANADGIIQGSADFSRLTELGKQQAAQVVQSFYDDDIAPIGIDSVYVSPLTRAQDTYKILRENILSLSSESTAVLPTTATTLQNLREIDFYDWTGHNKPYLIANYPDSYTAWERGDPYKLMVYNTKQEENAKSSGHEIQQHYPLLELWDRANQVWQEIMDLEDPKIMKASTANSNNNNKPHCLLLVAHGSLGQALLGTAMGWDATQFRNHAFPNCGMAEIQWHLPLHSSISKLGSSSSSRPLASQWRWKWPIRADEPNHNAWKTLETTTTTRTAATAQTTQEAQP